MLRVVRFEESLAWTAGNECFPMLSSLVKPKQPRACEQVIAFSMRTTVGYMWPMYSRFENMNVLLMSKLRAHRP